MKAGIPKTLRFALPVTIVALLCMGVVGAARHLRQSQADSASTTTPPQQISPEGRAWLEATIQSGNLPDLRWPNFSDYRAHLQKFYDSYGYSLPWVRGMQPSPQSSRLFCRYWRQMKKGSRPKITTGLAGTLVSQC